MTLSQTAILTKQVITISVFTLILGSLSFIGYKIWTAYYLANLPPIEEKPDTKFGMLPAPDFPQSTVSSSNFSYSIDTTTGILPKSGDMGFEKLVKVYFVTKTFASLLSGEKSQTLAQNFGIKSGPQILSETRYRFQEDNKTLTVDLDSGNFTFRKEGVISGQESLDDDSKLISDFKRNLQTLGVFKADLEGGPTKIIPLNSGGAGLVQISLWPPPLDKKPILTTDINKSLVNAKVLGRADSLDNYLSLDFIYYPIDTSTFATYPIKDTQEAFEDLRNGKGVVVIEPTQPQVSITLIYLAYYLPENYNPYLQPIYVFEGPHFVAYVAAVSPDLIGPD